MRHRNLLVAVLLGVGCAAPGDRQVVEVDVAAVPPAEEGRLTILEFGSYTCPLCREFHSRVYPLLRDSVIAKGRATYLYVDMSPAGVPAFAASAAECMVPHVGLEDAHRWGFEVSLLGDSGSVLKAIEKRMTPFQREAVIACALRPTQAPRRARVAAAADRLGVPGTPTFIIGQQFGTRVVGWPLVGLQEWSTLRRDLEEAEQLVRRWRADRGSAQRETAPTTGPATSPSPETQQL